MKVREFKKTLVLNKKTIAHLSEGAMGKVWGGKTDTYYTYCLYSCTGLPCTTDERETCGCYTINPRCP